MNELKPCPFCGRLESLNVREVHTCGRYCADMYCIECRRCLYCTMNFDTKDELYAFWNTRIAEERLKDKNRQFASKVDRLEEAIKEILNITDKGLDLGIEFIGAGLDGMTGGVEEWQGMKRARRKVRKLVKEALKKNAYAPDTNVGKKEREGEDE